MAARLRGVRKVARGRREVVKYHKNDCQGRGEHKLAADWAIAFGRTFDASVGIL